MMILLVSVFVSESVFCKFSLTFYICPVSSVSFLSPRYSEIKPVKARKTKVKIKAVDNNTSKISRKLQNSMWCLVFRKWEGGGRGTRNMGRGENREVGEGVRRRGGRRRGNIGARGGVEGTNDGSAAKSVYQ